MDTDLEKKKLLIKFAEGIKSKLLFNPKLSDYSWWKIGGYASCLIDIVSIEDLKSAIIFLSANSIPYCFIGEGTNILFDDEGFNGCIIRIGRKFSSFNHIENKCSVDAGHWVPSLVVKIAKLGFSGLEHAIGIPASLGGLVAMNGGSKRKSISEFIDSVLILDKNGEIREDKKSECEFSYRSSKYQNSKEVVLRVNFSFNRKRPYKQQRNEMLNILRERNLKFPRKQPSCGSVFKSSAYLFSNYGTPGRIIEELGFKGYRRGDIQVSNIHANFFINLGNGSSKDILSLVKEINDSVDEKLGIKMEPEFHYVHPQKGILKVI